MADAVAAQLARKRIRVGKNAARDPILAQASLDAAEILYRAMQQPSASRDRFVQERLRRYGPTVFANVVRKRAELRRKGYNAAQALYDAMRLRIADYYTERGVEAIQAATANVYGVDYGLGGTAQDVGCAITGGITAIGGGIVSLFSGGGGGYAVGAGGGAVGEAMGCNDQARRDMQQIANAQAREAEALVERARLEANAEMHRETEKTKRLIVGVAVGAGALLLVATGVMIVRA